MAVLEKALQIAHRSETSPGKSVNFAATPYGDREPVDPTNFLHQLGMGWFGGHPSPYLGFLEEPPAHAIGFGISKDYANPRPELRFMSAKGSGMGWTFTHEGRGKSTSYSQLEGGRSLRTVINEARDYGDSNWKCYSGGHVASSIILQQGVTSRIGLNGENIYTIQSATPDAFLSNLTLPQMPYILHSATDKERWAWWYLANGFNTDGSLPSQTLGSDSAKRAFIQNTLNYQLQGVGQGGIADLQYIDPFAGFATYRDQYTMKVGELMQRIGANPDHFFWELSSSRVLEEILVHHVTANGHSICELFQMEILTREDLERDLLHFEVSGSINSIINEAAQHGVWRAWWDSRCGFHFIPDYYAKPDEAKVACTIEGGPSLLGEIEVGRGSPDPLVHSYRVRPQALLSYGDSITSPLENNFDMVLGAVYPPGLKVGSGPGSDPIMDNYMGKDGAEQARRLFKKSNARTIFSWKNFPYPTLAMGLLHRVIMLKARDPKGAWDYSSGKLFVVENVSVDWQDNGRGGGVYLCSISGIEI
jgi:hypothetical protein